MKPDSSQQDQTTIMSSCAIGVEKVESDILAKKCGTSGCHDSVVHLNNLNLATPGVADRVVGHMAMSCPSQPLVTAGDPSKSFLFIKLQAGPTCNGSPSGIRMPLGSTPLNNDEMDCMRAWIMAQGGGASSGMDAGGTSNNVDASASSNDAGTDAARDAGTDARDAATDTNRRG